MRPLPRCCCKAWEGVEGMYKVVKRYFDRGIYTAGDVAKFVRAGKLDAAGYQEITGLEYAGE